MIHSEKIGNLYRLMFNGQRWYYDIINDDIRFFPSVTTIISATTPTSFAVKKLLSEMGWEKFNQMMTEKANYGTLLHIFIQRYFEQGKITFSEMDNLAAAYGKVDYEKHQYELKRDMLAIAKFREDYRVKPLKIEFADCYNDGDLMFAGTIDLIAEITVKEKGYWGEVYKTGENKGQPKETYQEVTKTALIDFKSGRNGFWDDHGIQLEMYRMMVAKDFNIQALINVAPKDWRTEPSYSVKDWTGDIILNKVPHMIRQFAVEFKQPETLILFKDEINGDVRESFETVNYSDYVKKLNKILI